jgi:poly(A) polymerase
MELAHWWEVFSTATDAVRRDMVDAVRLEQQKAKGPGKAQRVKRADPAPVDDDPRFREVDGEADEGDEPVSEAGAPARKRRRRRRKPTGGGAPAAPGAE